MAFTKKTWVNVPDPSNPPSIPEGQDALARFDAENMNRIEEGIEDAYTLVGGLTAKDIGGFYNLSYEKEYKTVLEAATIPNTSGYTFFAPENSELFAADDSAFEGREVQYLVLIDSASVGARRTVIAYNFSYNLVKMRRIFSGAWLNADWHSIITEGQTVNNSDMVDGLHSHNLATLTSYGESHGTSFPMFCQHNLRGDNRFGISVEGFEVGVDHATTADDLADMSSLGFVRTASGEYDGGGTTNAVVLPSMPFTPQIVVIVQNHDQSGEQAVLFNPSRYAQNKTFTTQTGSGSNLSMSTKNFYVNWTPQNGSVSLSPSNSEISHMNMGGRKYTWTAFGRKE